MEFSFNGYNLLQVRNAGWGMRNYDLDLLEFFLV